MATHYSALVQAWCVPAWWVQQSVRAVHRESTKPYIPGIWNIYLGYRCIPAVYTTFASSSSNKYIWIGITCVTYMSFSIRYISEHVRAIFLPCIFLQRVNTLLVLNLLLFRRRWALGWEERLATILCDSYYDWSPFMLVRCLVDPCLLERVSEGDCWKKKNMKYIRCVLGFSSGRVCVVGTRQNIHIYICTRIYLVCLGGSVYESTSWITLINTILIVCSVWYIRLAHPSKHESLRQSDVSLSMCHYYAECRRGQTLIPYLLGQQSRCRDKLVKHDWIVPKTWLEFYKG